VDRGRYPATCQCGSHSPGNAAGYLMAKHCTQGRDPHRKTESSPLFVQYVGIGTVKYQSSPCVLLNSDICKPPLSARGSRGQFAHSRRLLEHLAFARQRLRRRTYGPRSGTLPLSTTYTWLGWVFERLITPLTARPGAMRGTCTSLFNGPNPPVRMRASIPVGTVMQSARAEPGAELPANLCLATARKGSHID
jgi:hypothetical protein